MKIVGVDNHARETVADVLIKDGFPNTDEGKLAACAEAEAHNSKCTDDMVGYYHTVQPDDYRLSRGMADLV